MLEITITDPKSEPIIPSDNTNITVEMASNWHRIHVDQAHMTREEGENTFPLQNPSITLFVNPTMEPTIRERLLDICKSVDGPQASLEIVDKILEVSDKKFKGNPEMQVENLELIDNPAHAIELYTTDPLNKSAYQYLARIARHQLGEHILSLGDRFQGAELYKKILQVIHIATDSNVPNDRFRPQINPNS